MSFPQHMFFRRQTRAHRKDGNLLLVPPRAGCGDGRHGAAVSVLAQPAVDGRPKANDKGTRPRLETKRLEFERAYPGVPERVLGRIDVDIRGAVLVDKGQILTILVCQDRLLLGVDGQVAFLLKIKRLILIFRRRSGGHGYCDGGGVVRQRRRSSM